jgi:hypothetical protein
MAEKSVGGASAMALPLDWHQPGSRCSMAQQAGSKAQGWLNTRFKDITELHPDSAGSEFTCLPFCQMLRFPVLFSDFYSSQAINGASLLSQGS